eukprot:1031749-Rhodomonas_salina.1
MLSVGPILFGHMADNEIMGDNGTYRNLYPLNWEGVLSFGTRVEIYQMEHRLMSLATALQLVEDWNVELAYLRRVYPALKKLSNYPKTDQKLFQWRRQRDILVPAHLGRIAEYIGSLPPS